MNKKELLMNYFNFIRANAHLINRYPDIYLQQAINMPEESVLYKNAEKFIKLNNRKIINWKNKNNKPLFESITIKSSDWLSCCKWALNGQSIVTGSSSGKIFLWDSETGECINQLFNAHYDVVTDCSFSPIKENLLISVSRDCYFKLFDIDENKEIFKSEKFENDLLKCSWSYNGQYFIIIDRSGYLYIFNPKINKIKKKIRPHEWTITEISCSRNSLKFATCSESDRKIIIWDFENGAKIAEKNTGSRVSDCTWLDDNNIGYVTIQKEVCVWNINSDKKVIINGHDESVRSLSFNTNKKWLASCSSDRTVRIWDINSKSFDILSIIHGHIDGVNKCYWSPDGSKLASLCSDGSVKIWMNISKFEKIKDISSNVSSSDEIKIISFKNKAKKNIDPYHIARVNDCDITPDGKSGVSVSDDNDIKIWRIDKQKVIKTIKSESEIHSCSCSPDNNRMATVDFNHNIIIWEIKTGIRLNFIKENDMPVKCKWSPDGSKLAFLVYDTFDKAHVVIYNDINMKITNRIPLECGNFSWTNLPCLFDWIPNGKALIISGLNNIVLYDTEKFHTIKTISVNFKEVIDIKVSPDGKKIGIIHNGKFNIYSIDGNFRLKISSNILWKKFQWSSCSNLIFIIGKNDPMIHIYSSLDGNRIHSFYVTTFLSAITTGIDNLIFTGGITGEIFILQLLNFKKNNPIVYPIKIFSRNRLNKNGIMGDTPEIYCKCCGKLFDLKQDTKIQLINCPICKKELIVNY